MSRTIEVDLSEVRRVFDLFEKINGLFHQPMRYRDVDLVAKFADENYSEIKDLYYKVVWGWLPEDVKNEIDNE
ncbi:hypothetical protein [Chitinivorax sp. B]|uniref:hypothetical protein n=1 Tax=Chitinivorax sp. B TaxID=2502235 RepID=UPI0010F87AE3|nr:hypothetical protein [Chitinivorax sp. B]